MKREEMLCIGWTVLKRNAYIIDMYYLCHFSTVYYYYFYIINCDFLLYIFMFMPDCTENTKPSGINI